MTSPQEKPRWTVVMVAYEPSQFYCGDEAMGDDEVCDCLNALEADLQALRNELAEARLAVDNTVEQALIQALRTENETLRAAVADLMWHEEEDVTGVALGSFRCAGCGAWKGQHKGEPYQEPHAKDCRYDALTPPDAQKEQP